MQKSKWKRCTKLISGKEKPNQSWNLSTVATSDIYRSDQDCLHVLSKRFIHPPVSKEEKQSPIAFGLTVYKGARLFEKILRAVYMPNNIHCIHIDKKSSAVFRKEIQAVIRCLPNVFIASNSVDVTWGHISIVQAQFICMEELLKSTVKWKYYISLVGQDFPLYDNKQIVKALSGLNNFNNIVSRPVSKKLQNRTKYVHLLIDNKVVMTGQPKLPPPHNISIYKGSTHIIALRDFIEFVVHSKIAKDFYEFLKDTFIPDETIYSSLQRNPQAPGGINGNQPKSISRVLAWRAHNSNICHGKWVRSLCWISLKDLQWVLGKEQRDKLFVHKIPFDFNDDLIECILVARQGRKYATAVWKQGLWDTAS